MNLQTTHNEEFDARLCMRLLGESAFISAVLILTALAAILSFWPEYFLFGVTLYGILTLVAMRLDTKAMKFALRIPALTALLFGFILQAGRLDSTLTSEWLWICICGSIIGAVVIVELIALFRPRSKRSR